MKLTATFTTTLMLLSGAHSFSPSQRPSFRTRSSSSLLYEHVLEGRKVLGEIKPVNNFILVKTVGFKEATDDGIFLAGSSKVVKTQGTVVDVGPGKAHQETGRVFDIPLQKGDGVVYGEYDGTEINFNGQAYMLIRDDNVLVKYTGEKLTLAGVEVLGDCVLVEIDDDEQSTAGGVLLASTKSNEKRASTGTVKKVGTGKMAGDGTMIPVTVAEGDKVKFMDFAGNEIEIEGEEYSVVRMGEVIAKF